MKYKSLELIEQLSRQTKEYIAFVDSLKTLSFDDLNKRIHESSWNVLECVAHLNLYGNFYLPEISKRLTNSQSKATAEFNSGFLGNYFAKSILPKGRVKKMKTFQEMDPINMQLDKSVLDIFIEQQAVTLELLTLAKSKDLSKIRTNVSISKWLKIRLGDTFRFLINHNLRHIIQIKAMLSFYGIHNEDSQISAIADQV